MKCGGSTGSTPLFLGSSFLANKFARHLVARGDISRRKEMLLKGETTRKVLGIPCLSAMSNDESLDTCHNRYSDTLSVLGYSHFFTRYLISIAWWHIVLKRTHIKSLASGKTVPEQISL